MDNLSLVRIPKNLKMCSYPFLVFFAFATLIGVCVESKKNGTDGEQGKIFLIALVVFFLFFFNGQAQTLQEKSFMAL